MLHGARVIWERNKIVVLVVIAVFVLASVSCVFACASGDDCCDEDQSTESICLCQTPGTDPNSSVAVQSVSETEFLPSVVTQIKSREVVASIFNPPKQ